MNNSISILNEEQTHFITYFTPNGMTQRELASLILRSERTGKDELAKRNVRTKKSINPSAN